MLKKKKEKSHWNNPRVLEMILCSDSKLVSLRCLQVLLEARTGAWVLDKVEKLLDILFSVIWEIKMGCSPVLGNSMSFVNVSSHLLGRLRYLTQARITSSVCILFQNKHL